MNKLLVCLLLLPVAVQAQQTVSLKGEPLHLYQQIHNDLASDRVKAALRHFDDVVTYYKARNEFDQLPENYFGMALGLALNNHYRESIRYHKKAIRLHRKYKREEPMEIYMNLGLTYSLAGKDRRARRILEIFHYHRQD